MKRIALIAFVLAVGFLALASQAAFLAPQVQPLKLTLIYDSFSYEIAVKEKPLANLSFPVLPGDITHEIELIALFQSQV